MKKSYFTLRRMTVILMVTTVIAALSACNNKDSDNVKRFQEAALNLNNTHHTLTEMYDYWPDCGIRVTGSHLASLISLDELQKMLPCPLYVSGPHHDGQWDLNNYGDFGHYNPEAIQYLAKLAKKVVADQSFVQASRTLVDEYLSSKMKCMMVLYDALHDKELPSHMLMESDVKTIREEILQEIVDNNGYCYDLSCFFIGSMYIDEVPYNYGLGDQLLYFWARRWSDGTMDDFYNAISTVYKAYHPEYQFHYDDYWNEMEEYGEGEWYEGEDYSDDGDYYGSNTVYNCELEDDEPVTDKERIKEKDAVEIIRSAANNLDKTSLVFENEFDYWPECGIRVTGGHLFSLISLRTLNRMLPCELYVSGPHHYNRWELDSPYEFGRYNPEAVRYLNQLATNVVSDKQFVEKTKPLVDKYLKRQMLIMKQLYDGLNDKSICEDKQEVLNSIMGCQGHPYGTLAGSFLYDMNNAIEDGSFVYSNTGEMFLYWWARRDEDGTMEQFHDILETVYQAYYGK